MRVLKDLFANNRAWAADMKRQDNDFFSRLSRRAEAELSMDWLFR